MLEGKKTRKSIGEKAEVRFTSRITGIRESDYEGGSMVYEMEVRDTQGHFVGFSAIPEEYLVGNENE